MLDVGAKHLHAESRVKLDFRVQMLRPYKLRVLPSCNF